MATLTAYITCDGAADALIFYQRAFDGVERYRIPMDDGRLGHAEIAIGDTVLMLSDEAPEYEALAPTRLGGSTCALVLEVEDPDAVYARAVAAGATAVREVRDEPYGRGGWLRDPFGHRWNVMRPDPDFDPSQF